MNNNWTGGRLILLMVMALILIPVFALQAVRERRAAAKGEARILDTEVPVKFYASTTGQVVEYLDGKTLPTDAYAVATLTWTDYGSAANRFGDVDPKPVEADFPLVVFFNTSGFDITGDPMFIRRAKDGSLLYQRQNMPKRVRQMTPKRDGTYDVIYYDGATANITSEAWVKYYMRLAPEPPDDKPDQAKPDPAHPFLPPAAKPSDIAMLDTGVKGQIVHVGGGKAVTPLEVHLLALKGEVKPVETSADLEDDQIAAETDSNPDGFFMLELPPGTYTLVYESEGLLRGNSTNRDAWPTLEITDGWLTYEIRAID